MEGSGNRINYEYSPATGNMNGRTLKYFSSKAEEKMRPDGSGEYFPDFKLFVDYYGTATYADQLIMAAFLKSTTSFSNGNQNFAGSEFDARGEVIKKLSAYMSTGMYSIREMEDGIVQCAKGCEGESCANDPDNSLDEAVAFYTGSLEGVDGSGVGVFYHSLADKRCINFKTCGENGDTTTGTSMVNIKIFEEYKLFQTNINAKKCDEAKKNKEAIVKQMKVPLIQGALRYAYLAGTEFTGKGEAEGAAFSAAVLPWVHKCSAKDAEFIYDNMRVGSGSNTKFKDVKKAFENTYGCMGIKCADVGGVLDSAGNYVADGSPCASGAVTFLVVNFMGLSMIGSFVVAIMPMF
jgi:Low iron-inducible periplasmic protein